HIGLSILRISAILASAGKVAPYEHDNTQIPLASASAASRSRSGSRSASGAGAGSISGPISSTSHHHRRLIPSITVPRLASNNRSGPAGPGPRLIQHSAHSHRYSQSRSQSRSHSHTHSLPQSGSTTPTSPSPAHSTTDDDDGNVDDTTLAHHGQQRHTSSPRNPIYALHPTVAVVLGVDHRWNIPLILCRGLSVLPATWWGLRCAFTFLAELLHINPQVVWQESLQSSIAAGASAANWDVERRFRVTEVALAIMWCSALLYYTPPAVVIRLLTINALISYLTSWILYLTGASSDPRLLLPAWISIAAILTITYHISQRQINIKKETSASLSVFSIASFISMSLLLLQLHLTRENEPEVPIFTFMGKVMSVAAKIIARYGVVDGHQVQN
ncbi:hypothetical protein KEM54_001975, partial [Ascosphaera aggregata]